MPEPDARPLPSFGQRLRAAMAARGPLCVGIDPHPSLLSAWGLNDDAGGLERFSLTVLDAVGEQAAALKPQVALYERHGSAGLAVLERLLAASADAGTLSPYLGYGSLRPALDLAAATGRGVFVLALTSNSEGASVQHVGGAE